MLGVGKQGMLRVEGSRGWWWPKTPVASPWTSKHRPGLALFAASCGFCLLAQSQILCLLAVFPPTACNLAEASANAEKLGVLMLSLLPCKQLVDSQAT